MTVDLEQFHAAFYDESFEALATMETTLLQLDVGAPEPELINTIFRVAHSIKGGSATFGFTDIASFTHSLESLLDALRGGTMSVTAAVCDLLLRAVDVLRALLRARQAGQPIDAQRVADLQFDLEVALAGRSAAAPAQPVPARVAPAGARTPSQWQVRFRPHRELFVHGNDPLRLVQALAAIAEVDAQLDAQNLPPLAALDPEDCHLAWTLSVRGPIDSAQIQQIFDWAEGDCELLLQSVPAEPAEPAESVTPPVAVAAPAPPPASPAAPSPPAPLDTSAKTQAANGLADHGSIRVSVEKIDELMNSVGELVITQAMLTQLGAKIEGPQAEPLRVGLAQLERNMRELQESVMRVRMLPISFVFSRFPRMVHDLAQQLGKQIELKLTGEHTELDKTVLEKIGDPLVHLVRNCIDHGIELPAARMAAGKPPAGTVQLAACHRGGNIVVEVSDDGGGLDAARILRKARERGLIGPHDTPADAQILELIFRPGFSTAEQTTDLSGRGVGMDVVRRNVKELGGKIELASQAGRGARFTITLPLTLAIVDGQLVSVGTETYIVPLTSIVESLQLSAAQISRISAQGEVFACRGEYLPIIRLHSLFGVEPRARALHEGLVVVAEGDGRHVGLFVDDLLGQQQVVIKSLQTHYGHIEGVAGATILGDGAVALILDVPGLIRGASGRAAA